MAEQVNTVSVPTDQLAKMATYVDYVGPQLERLRKVDTDLTKAAESTVDTMIRVGVLPQSNRQSALDEINKGGVAKLAEAVAFVSQHVGTRPLGQAKQASAVDTEPGQRPSDAAWKRGMLGR